MPGFFPKGTNTITSRGSGGQNCNYKCKYSYFYLIFMTRRRQILPPPGFPGGGGHLYYFGVQALGICPPLPPLPTCLQGGCIFPIFGSRGRIPITTYLVDVLITKKIENCHPFDFFCFKTLFCWFLGDFAMRTKPPKKYKNANRKFGKNLHIIRTCTRLGKVVHFKTTCIMHTTSYLVR